MTSLKTVTLSILTCYMLCASAQDRDIDGGNNNLFDPLWGASHTEISREMTNGYADGISEPGMTDFSNPREISNYIYDQTGTMPNVYDISDYAWSFGQFIDHDITLVDDMPDEFFNISVPMGDPMFDPENTGTQEIVMKRSKYDPDSGTSIDDPRVLMNEITAWMDGSGVYGSDQDRADWLRTFEEGRLKTSTGDLLPFNTVDGQYASAVDETAPFMIIEGVPMEKHFVAGDPRANEQPILSGYHTLFVREHNRLCDELAIAYPDWNDEELYQRARKFVGAYIQSIAYGEWLPTLGVPIADYEGYDDQAYPNIMNVFSAAAFRLGHTLLNGDLLRMDENGLTIPEGDMQLQEAFFNPMVLVEEGGVDPLFRGMATQAQQSFDTKVVGDVRNFLFGAPGAGGLDLVAININRGRERGLPTYSTIREDLGMTGVTDFDDITTDSDLQFQLMMMYGTVEAIDPWVGMLAEDHATDAAIGPTVQLILSHQFERLRNADRFFYLNDMAFSEEEKQGISQTLLSDIIRRNTGIELIQDDVFHIVPFSELVGLSEHSDHPLRLDVYPNPTDGPTAFSTEQAGHLRIVGLDGRLIEERRIDAGRHEVLLSNGIQLVEFTSSDGVRSSQRVVVF